MKSIEKPRTKETAVTKVKQKTKRIVLKMRALVRRQLVAKTEEILERLDDQMADLHEELMNLLGDIQGRKMAEKVTYLWVSKKGA